MNAKKTPPGRHRHLVLMLLLVLLLLLTVAAVVVTSVIILVRTTREHRTQIIENTARLAATCIDGSKVEGWMENGKDEDYEATAEALENILHNTPFLQYLYVYQIKEDGCHVVFDFDSVDAETGELVEGDPLGWHFDFDESWEHLVPTLLSGGAIDTVESRDTFGWLLTRYEPIFDSSGKCVCYVGADLSMKGVQDYVTGYVIRIAVIGVIFLIG